MMENWERKKLHIVFLSSKKKYNVGSNLTNAVVKLSLLHLYPIRKMHMDHFLNPRQSAKLNSFYHDRLGLYLNFQSIF